MGRAVRAPGGCQKRTKLYFMYLTAFIPVKVQFTMNSVHWVVNSVQCTRYSARVYSVGSYMQGLVWHTWEINKQSLTQGGIICTVYSVHCTVYIVQCTFYSVQCTVYSVQCTVYSIQGTVYTLYSTLYTVHCPLLHCTLFNVYCCQI